MQIIDLNQGKYPIADAFMGIRLDKFVLSCQTYRGPFNKSFLFNSLNAGTIQQKQYCFLQKVPVFLVDTSMSGTKFLVPETGMMRIWISFANCWTGIPARIMNRKIKRVI